MYVSTPILWNRLVYDLEGKCLGELYFYIECNGNRSLLAEDDFVLKANSQLYWGKYFENWFFDKSKPEPSYKSARVSSVLWYWPYVNKFRIFHRTTKAQVKLINTPTVKRSFRLNDPSIQKGSFKQNDGSLIEIFLFNQ